MKIEQLTIYGFGKHTDTTINLGEGITVFYGENEAGKTTIYQFILHILFGFPPKNHALLRYEPKTGAAYGGKVKLLDSTHGMVEVERIRGKSAGDVTVRFADGTLGGQETLQELLRQYDRTAFESIFSFSLFQLQGLERMDADELSRTLLSSGTTGIDLLLQLEKRLEKEKGELFKKSGKIPEMNVLLRELRELEDTLKSERAKVEEYEPAVNRLQEIEQELTAKQSALQNYRTEAETLHKVQLRIPIIENRDKLLAQLDDLGVKDFPVNGIREQEMLESKKHEANAKISRAEFQLESLTDQLKHTEPAERRASIEALLSKESIWQLLQQQVKGTIAEIERLQQERHRLAGRLGASDSSAVSFLLQADGSLTNEQHVHELASRLQQARHSVQSCEAERRRTKELEKRSTQQLRQLTEQAPSAEEQAQAAQWPSVRLRIAEAKAYVSYNKEQVQTNSKHTSWILTAMAVAVTLYGLFQQQWPIVVLGLLMVALGGAGLLKKKPENSQSDERLKEMKALLKAYEGKEESFEELCKRTDEYIRKSEQLRLTIEGHALQLEAQQTGQEQAQMEEQTIRTELAEALKQCGLPAAAGMEVIPELFRMIRELHETENRLTERKKEYDRTLNEIIHHLERASSVMEREVPEADLYTLIRQEAQNMREAELAAKSDIQQTKKLKRTIEEARLELEAYQEQEMRLFASAGAADKSSFYDVYDRWQQSQTLQMKIQGLTEQLDPLRAAEAEKWDGEAIEHHLSSLEKQRAAAEQEVAELTDERAALNHRTEALLSDDAHLLTQQVYENKKSEFNALAAKWSVFQAAAEAIRQTMDDLKEKKLPAVLARANEFFSQLTSNTYASIEIQPEGQFEAVRSDGQTFAIAELSQATKEQAYLSLRLSLAVELTAEAPFPIIMDDPFVHFDAHRLSQMTGLLSELSSSRQFIIFTCHETLAAHWPDATIIKVSEIGKHQEAKEYEKIIGS